MKYLITAIALALPTLTVASNDWGLEPLGKKIDIEEQSAPPIKQELKSFHKKFPAEGNGLTLFENGEPRGIIIIPASPSEAEQKAANLLKDVSQKMAGKSLPVLTEEKIRVEGSVAIDTQGNRWQNAIWLGNTAQAAKQNIHADDLKPEGYRLKTVDGWLFVVANDKAHIPTNGAIFAAAGLLEDYLGVRWLWPGDVGTVIPQNANVTLPAIHEQNEPALLQRLIRNGVGTSDRHEIGLKLLGGTEEDRRIMTKTQTDGQDWAARLKSGGSLNLNYRHAFSNWYKKYGEKHPEWFALQANGTRKQGSDRPRLCKGNPEVAKQKAKEIIEQYKENPNMDSASISLNDGSGVDSFCMCSLCRQLDPPNGRIIDMMFMRDGKRMLEKYPSLSDRVATFYNRIAEEVAKTLPNAKLGAYAYSAYRDVPLGVTLHPSIIIGFVGLNYFDEQMRQEDLQRWDGWSRHSSELFLRPNISGQGNALPAVYTQRLGEDIRHCYQTGMTIGDFDSLTGNWATQGLNFYVLAKLLWNPAEDVDALVKDYCEKGFGSASEYVRAYFSELEKALVRVAKREGNTVEGELREEEDDTAAARRRVERDALESAYFNVFTAEFVEHLRGLLKQASEATKDEAVLARIEFLAQGLEYADLYRATVEEKDNKQARKQLLDWYRKTHHEHPHAVDTVMRLWRTNALFRGIH